MIKNLDSDNLRMLKVYLLSIREKLKLIPFSSFILHPSFEAATGIEPVNKGFADLRLSRLATPPNAVYYTTLTGRAKR